MIHPARALPLALAALLGAGPSTTAGARAAAEPGPDPAAEAAAPVGAQVMDLEAIKRALKERRGHVVLLHFWATWCSPCLEELPVIDRFARESKARGVEVLSLSLDDPERSAARVTQVLADVAPSLTRSIARVENADAFIGTFDHQWEGSIPALFAYDAGGQLRGHLIGEATRQDLDQLVGRALRLTARARRAH
jgi:thiol-disulfide isomerase/thioredoxin